MRTLKKGNKVSFIILGISISFILGLLSIFIIKYTKGKSDEYKIASGSVVYDRDNTFIKTTSEGNLTQKWTGDYYLDVDGNKYNLGRQSVVYNSNTGGLVTYGNIYKILEDASVAAESAATEIDNNIPVSFYKLADRKYLITGDSIMVNEENIMAQKYLIIDIDKSGNSQIFNHQINQKMLNPITVSVGKYTFDVAKENLEIDGESINLAKIGGSTNEFASLNDVNNIEEQENDKNENNMSNNTENGVLNGGQGNLLGGNTENQIIQGGNLNIGGGTNINLGSSSNIGNIQKPRESTLKINYVESKPNNLRVNYSINDYENKFSAIFLIVEDVNNNKQKIILNKGENIKVITGLSPDTAYTIHLGATVSSIINGFEENIDSILDVFKTRTSEINSSLILEKFSSKEIKFNFKVDSSFKLTSANAVLYIGNEEKDKIAIDVDKASSYAGWSSKFNIEEYVDEAKEFTIKIEDAIYNETSINITSEVNIKNGFAEKIKRSFERFYNRIF